MGKKLWRQVESVLFILDERGFITSFSMGRTKALTDFRSVLNDVSRRSPDLKVILTGKNINYLSDHKFKLTYIFLDNCCADRRTLESVFGSEVLVKLDTFHGIARITQTVKKKDMSPQDRRKVICQHQVFCLSKSSQKYFYDFFF
jgi:hypothetical protein